MNEYTITDIPSQLHPIYEKQTALRQINSHGYKKWLLKYGQKTKTSTHWNYLGGISKIKFTTKYVHFQGLILLREKSEGQNYRDEERVPKGDGENKKIASGRNSTFDLGIRKGKNSNVVKFQTKRRGASQIHNHFGRSDW